jgi:Ca2+-binding RTX toxin-like protein
MADITGDSGNNIIVGTSDPDNIYGLGGNDTINGAAGDDVVNGGDGDDVLNGSGENDILDGGAGDDSVNGGAGHDILIGGLGDDKYEGSAGLDNLSFFGSAWTSFYGTQSTAAGAINLFYRGVTVDLAITTAQNTGQGMDTILNIENLTGSAYIDRFSGNSAANIIEGRAGDDWLAGRGGADSLHGGDGNDVIDANSDFGTGSQIYGADDGAIDYVTGGLGNDLIGVSNRDIADGGDGIDTLMVTLTAAANLDLSTGALAALQAVTNGTFTNFELFNVVGSAFADTITGDSGSNEIWGMAGDDIINGGAAYDALFGGEGNDTLTGGGVDGDRLVGGLGSDVLIGGDGADYISANQGVLDINGLTFLGTTQDDGAVDTVTGGAGNDVIYVGLGDNADGGDGTVDVLYVTFDNHGSALNINLSTGGAAALSAVSGGTYAGFERYSLFGTAYADSVIGDAGVNNLWGRGGNDVMYGGDSGDLLGGNDGDDVLYGENGNDALYGGAGADTMYGGEGDDFIYAFSGTQGEPFSPGNDIVDGGNGRDMLSFNPTLIGSYAGQSNVANAFLVTTNITINLAVTGAQNTGVGIMTITNIEDVVGGQGNDTFFGNGANNFFWGGDGNDYLNGWGGDDSLYGGGGDDLLRGETGVDYFDGGTGFDRISFYNPNSTQGVIADLRTGVISNDGFGNQEFMTNIEALGVVTRFADILHGNDSDNLLYASLGDSVYGHGGNDRFEVDSAMAVLDGGDGFDVITSFYGSRFIDANNDGVSDSEFATHGVFVNLATQQIVDDGFGGSATIVSIEGAYGSSFGDRIQGSWEANEIGGLAGNDILIGWGGDDRIYGGDGDDIMYGEEGTDVFYGGEGFDRVSFYNFWATQGVIADLRTQTILNDGFGNSELMYSVEGLGAGTRFADVFHGNDSDNLILAAGGDTAYGYGGDDDFQLDNAPLLIDGGAGIDTITLFTGTRLIDANGDGVAEVDNRTAGVIVNLATRQIINDGYGGTGEIKNIENLGGSEFNDTLTGSNVDNEMDGWLGDDLVAGGAGNDTIHGDTGDDVLKGEVGDDFLYGDADDDTLIGGAGADYLDGGDGFDKVSYSGSQAVTVDLGLVNAQNTGGGGIDTLVGIEAVEGTLYADNITGSIGANTLIGGSGNDYLRGLLGGDAIYGDAGDDIIYGNGDDALSEDDDDTLFGGAGNDAVYGGGGSDEIYGEIGNDTLNGEDGDDYIDGGAGNDTINGGYGYDDLVGGDGVDTISGGGDADDISGGAGNDFLYGDDGDDTIHGNDGIDTVDGGRGNDYVAGGLGNDVLRGGGDDDTLEGEDGTDKLYGDDGEDTLTGGIGADRLEGGAGDDVLSGGADGDTLLGGDGDDLINGGAGRDTMTGGAGEDRFIFVTGDSTPALRDTITDFEDGIDILDLSGIDANSNLADDQAFTIVTKFTGVAGQLVVKVAASSTQVLADIDGDGVADFSLLLTGQHADTTGWVL